MNSQQNASVLDKYDSIIDTMSGINYIIDKDYRIVVYSKEKWDEFAESNDGYELTEDENVKGRLVLDHFSGEKVKNYYKQLYDLIFKGIKSEIVIKAKCDAPEALRDNVLYLTPIFKDPKEKDEVVGILHQSLIMKVEQRPDRVNLLKRRDNLPDTNAIEICSLCKNVKVEISGATRWISPKDYKEMSGDENRKLDHSICDSCTIKLDEFM